jgi:hypothetical protein
MYAGYQAWFQDVASTRGFAPVRIALGSPRENPTILTRQDWRGPHAGWEPNDLGYWEVNVEQAGRFDILAQVAPRRFRTMAHVALGGSRAQRALAPGQTECSFAAVDLPPGPGRLEAWVEGNNARAGVLELTVRRLTE